MTKLALLSARVLFGNTDLLHKGEAVDWRRGHMPAVGVISNAGWKPVVIGFSPRAPEEERGDAMFRKALESACAALLDLGLVRKAVPLFTCCHTERSKCSCRKPGGPLWLDARRLPHGCVPVTNTRFVCDSAETSFGLDAGAPTVVISDSPVDAPTGVQRYASLLDFARSLR